MVYDTVAVWPSTTLVRILLVLMQSKLWHGKRQLAKCRRDVQSPETSARFQQRIRWLKIAWKQTLVPELPLLSRPRKYEYACHLYLFIRQSLGFWHKNCPFSLSFPTHALFFSWWVYSDPLGLWEVTDFGDGGGRRGKRRGGEGGRRKEEVGGREKGDGGTQERGGWRRRGIN